MQTITPETRRRLALGLTTPPPKKINRRRDTRPIWVRVICGAARDLAIPAAAVAAAGLGYWLFA